MRVTQSLRCLTVRFGINYIPQGTIELILRDDFVPVRYVLSTVTIVTNEPYTHFLQSSVSSARAGIVLVV
jgi:hypothetical protein